jgi:hypothetical protein
MNPLSMETMFLILSGVILAAGVLYWFWSHIQLTQKKVQLLENAVFELRSMMAPPGPSGGEGQSLEPAGQQETYKDLDDDDWAEQAPPEQPVQVQVEVIGREPFVREEQVREEQVREEPVVREEPAHADFMAELQARNTVDEKVVEASSDQTLEGLTLKELRRMASERGITGTSDMKKKDVISALRNTVSAPDAPVEVTLESI